MYEVQGRQFGHSVTVLIPLQLHGIGILDVTGHSRNCRGILKSQTAGQTFPGRSRWTVTVGQATDFIEVASGGGVGVAIMSHLELGEIVV